MKKLFTILLTFILIFTIGCNKPKDTFFYFDAPISLVFYEKSQLNKHSKNIEEILIEVHNATDINNPNSDISKFNNLKQGESLTITQTTKELVEYALNMYNATNGAFNPLIYPLTHLWKFSPKTYKDANFCPPTVEQITQALQLCDISGFSLSGNNLTKLKDGIQIDVGGIAKGFASDKVANYLKENNVTKGYITMGSSTIYLLEKKDDINWNLSIRHPDNSNNLLMNLKLSNKHISTSGTYERYYDYNGIKYSHILDTKTGTPISNGMKSVTVIYKESAFADALSTALCVMGHEKAIDFTNEFNAKSKDKLTIILAYEKDGINYYYTNAEDFELIDNTYIFDKQ